MTATKYISLADLKAYMTSNHIIGTTDDDFLYQAINRAEGQVDAYCGSRFDLQTFTLTQPFIVFVDGNGWLKLTAYEVGPVTAVSAVQVLNVGAGETVWKTITWDAANGILLPLVTVPPKPNAWDVMIKPSPPLATAYVGSLYAKWSYTGGYGTLGGSPDLPDLLKAIVSRLSYWNYMMREAPVGKVVTAELGLMTIPLSIPPDIAADLGFWKRSGS